MISLIEMGQVVLEKKIFKLRQYFFTLLILFPLEKGMVLRLKQKLNHLHPRMVCT